jgi:hypothetical protein
MIVFAAFGSVMTEVSPLSTRVCPALERNICEADCCGGAPGWANCMVVVQLEDAGGAGGAGGVGAEGGVGGAGVLKNDKILTYYYAFQAWEADQSFTIGKGPKVLPGPALREEVHGKSDVAREGG